MGNSNSSRHISAQDRAILDMKIQRDKLHQYQRKISVLTDREVAIAKKLLLKGDKQRALLALRRKKYQESLLSKTDAQLEQLEKLAGEVEFALVQKDIVFGLQQGTKVLKEINKEMGGIEAVEKLMEENEEARAYQREMSELLGGSISAQEEDEVEEELDALTAEVATREMPNAPSVAPPSLVTPERDSEQQREELAPHAEARSKSRVQEPIPA